jgi:hypothetical protein
MESGEGLANAVLQARMNAARRDAWGWEAEFHKARAQQKESANHTWYWGVIFRAFRAVFWELAKRYPNDPLFKATGRKRLDGSPELEYHRLFAVNAEKEIAALPSDVPKGRDLKDFIAKAKI